MTINMIPITVEELTRKVEWRAKAVGYASRGGTNDAGGPLGAFLEAVELYAVPAAELVEEDWIALASLATSKAVERVEDVLEDLLNLQTALSDLRREVTA